MSTGAFRGRGDQASCVRKQLHYQSNKILGILYILANTLL